MRMSMLMLWTTMDRLRSRGTGTVRRPAVLGQVLNLNTDEIAVSKTDTDLIMVSETKGATGITEERTGISHSFGSKINMFLRVRGSAMKRQIANKIMKKVEFFIDNFFWFIKKLLQQFDRQHCSTKGPAMERLVAIIKTMTARHEKVLRLL